jgi:hypothetical protein
MAVSARNRSFLISAIYPCLIGLLSVCMDAVSISDLFRTILLSYLFVAILFVLFIGGILRGINLILFARNKLTKAESVISGIIASSPALFLIINIAIDAIKAL